MIQRSCLLPHARRLIRQETEEGLLAPPLGQEGRRQRDNGEGESGQLGRKSRVGGDARRQSHQHNSSNGSGTAGEGGKKDKIGTGPSFVYRDDKDMLGLVLRHVLLFDTR